MFHFFFLDISKDTIRALLDKNRSSSSRSSSSSSSLEKNNSSNMHEENKSLKQSHAHCSSSPHTSLTELSQVSYHDSVFSNTIQDHRSTYAHGSLLIRSPSRSADFLTVKGHQVLPPTSNSPSSPSTDSPLSFKSPKILPPFITTSSTTLKTSDPSKLDYSSSSGSGFTARQTMMAMRSSSLKAVDQERRRKEESNRTTVELKNIPQNIPIYVESSHFKEDWEEEYERHQHQQRREEEEEYERHQHQQQKEGEEAFHQDEDFTEIRFSSLHVKHGNMLPSHLQESVKKSLFKDSKSKEVTSLSSQRYGIIDYTDNDEFLGENRNNEFDEDSLKNLYSLHDEYLPDSVRNNPMTEQRERNRDGEKERREREVGREEKRDEDRDEERLLFETEYEEESKVYYQNNETTSDVEIEGRDVSDDFLSSHYSDFTKDVKKHNNREEHSFRVEHIYQEEDSFREENPLNDSHLSGQTQFWVLSDSDEEDSIICTYEDYESTCLFDDTR